jgi:hypothetical protein
MEAAGYIAHLMGRPCQSSCVLTYKVLQISHDEVTDIDAITLNFVELISI